jgi:hypothetical protein
LELLSYSLLLLKVIERTGFDHIYSFIPLSEYWPPPRESVAIEDTQPHDMPPPIALYIADRSTNEMLDVLLSLILLKCIKFLRLIMILFIF